VQVKLTLKYFDYDDLGDLNDWLKARGKPPQEYSDIPAIGFVVIHEDQKLVACFLRRCEGNMGIVDGLTSNPSAPSELRHVALDLAISSICEEAKQREISHLIAWTLDKGTLERGCLRHGFQKSPHTFLAKDLVQPLNTH